MPRWIIFSRKRTGFTWAGYFGRDVFTYRNARRVFKADIPWGNSTATLRWNHVFSRKLFANTTVVYNDYAFSFGATQNDFNIKLIIGYSWLERKNRFWFAIPPRSISSGLAQPLPITRSPPTSWVATRARTSSSPIMPWTNMHGETGIYLQDDWDIEQTDKVNAQITLQPVRSTGAL